MEQHVFAFSLNTEGATEKVLQFSNATEVNLKQKSWFDWAKSVFLNTAERFKQ